MLQIALRAHRPLARSAHARARWRTSALVHTTQRSSVDHHSYADCERDPVVTENRASEVSLGRPVHVGPVVQNQVAAFVVHQPARITEVTECGSIKEVIQPQVPLRLPCYDFTPIIDPTVGASLPCGLGERLRVEPTFVV